MVCNSLTIYQLYQQIHPHHMDTSQTKNLKFWFLGVSHMGHHYAKFHQIEDDNAGSLC